MILLCILAFSQNFAQDRAKNKPKIISDVKKYTSPAGNPIFLDVNFNYNITNYGIKDGLSQSEARCVFIDSRQIVWIGTYGGGLNKFDGKKFEYYSQKDGLPDNIIWKILEDDEKNKTRQIMSSATGET